MFFPLIGRNSEAVENLKVISLWKASKNSHWIGLTKLRLFPTKSDFEMSPSLCPPWVAVDAWGSAGSCPWRSGFHCHLPRATEKHGPGLQEAEPKVGELALHWHRFKHQHQHGTQQCPHTQPCPCASLCSALGACRAPLTGQHSQHLH